jgi:glycosyltransferase involved in cell wall biosynthesis
VLAFRNGSVPEVIDDGVTGRIVDTVEEAIAAVPSVLALDRRRVRRTFEERFSATRMAKNYVSLYRRLLNKPEPIRRTNGAGLAPTLGELAVSGPDRS